jgi:hypothetical protein
MSAAATEIHREPWDVDRRLHELGLTRKGLLKVVAVATNASGNATPYHCANAAGTFSYQQGTWALRNEFVGKGWKLDRTNNVEAIWNESLKVRVVFSNVDVACHDEQEPKPRSKKGAGAERICQGNLFGDLPRFVTAQYRGDATFYLMVDQIGKAELTRPVVSGETFSAFIERNYLFDEEGGTDDKLRVDSDDAADNFDPKIVRK